MSGLTPLWLMVLAAILAVLVGIGGGASQLAVYEVLRDFQTLIAAFIAMGVGYYAARPVYLQLKEARRQTSALLHELLRAKLEVFARQTEVASRIKFIAIDVQDMYERDPSQKFSCLETWIANCKSQLTAIDEVRPRIEEFLREAVGAEIYASADELRVGLIVLSVELKNAARRIAELKNQIAFDRTEHCNIVNVVGEKLLRASNRVESVSDEFSALIRKRIRILRSAADHEFDAVL